MGSDLTEAMRIAGEMEFQFALPHGERRTALPRIIRRWSFNSRSRMGSDGFPGRLSARP